MSEGEALIFNTDSIKINFDEENGKNGGKEFILTANFYKNPNYAALLAPRSGIWKVSQT